MGIKLSIRHLQMIKQIAECGSVTEAANGLGVTQSALSHRIRETERLLGTVIFYRKNKLLTLTNAGKRLLHSAEIILGEVTRVEYDISKLSQGIESIVRLGTDVYGSYHWLPQFLGEFNRSHPEIGTEIIADVSLDPLAALRRGDIDLAIMPSMIPAELFQTSRLFRDELLAILPHAHAKAGQAWLEPEAFASENYITHHTNPEKGLVYEQLFSCYNVLPRQVMRMGIMEVIIEFVQHGFGVSILPSFTICKHLESKRISTMRVTEQGLFVDWHTVMRRHEPDDSPTTIFSRALSEWTHWKESVSYNA
ncbi:LysR family transcriptional regulator [Sedimenticola selenatireducens]|nr:LysR family transcriptional regulator [Sedimenticola selenatireducens]